MAILKDVLYLLIYPGIFFLMSYSMFVEWVDRKVYARLQNRCGPLHTGYEGMLQPLADFIKLMLKEDIIPERADRFMFAALPVIGLTIVSTAALLLPVWHYADYSTFNSFQGDLIVIIYLLSMATLVFFLAGWHSTNPFSTLGGVRVITMLFGYEIPFLLVLLGPAILADSWRMTEIAAFYQAKPLLLLINIIGFFVALISLQAKLERTPFDIPHAETEIVGGTFTEFSGKKYAFFRLMTSIELIVGSGVISAVFLGGFPGGLWLGFAWFIIKTTIIVILLSLIRALHSRIRVEQVVSFAWKYLMPLAVIQILIVIIAKGLIG
ncbi:MAG: NADH-quinone oxidoreductase subunit H [Elusimicrobia bacterium]|nr:NADH-quinone oxidoreductase subunit H [Elusimicrobiota bacterium]MBU2614842.1 NADH-quinone oxidoreductase subunit H [Elusimicrobiota bacterium]